MTKQLQNDTKFLSGYVYHNENYKNNHGFQFLHKEEDRKSGFYAEAYFKNGRIYVVYKGTDDITMNFNEGKKDIINDIDLNCRNIPSQVIHARNFHNYIARKYRKYPIYATGHSLGGSLAQIVASTTKELVAITYNAFGPKNIKGFHPRYPENVTNYGNAKDIIFTKNIDNHIGKTYLIDDNSSDRKHAIKYHGVEYMGDTDKAVEYKPQKKGHNSNPQPKNRIDKVHDMIQKHEEKLKQKKSSSSGSIHVSAYKSGDGTDVSSYYRSR